MLMVNIVNVILKKKMVNNVKMLVRQVYQKKANVFHHVHKTNSLTITYVLMENHVNKRRFIMMKIPNIVVHNVHQLSPYKITHVLLNAHY